MYNLGPVFSSYLRLAPVYLVFFHNNKLCVFTRALTRYGQFATRTMEVTGTRVHLFASP
jgi:hypothetical protein